MSEEYTLPKNWRWVKLREVCEINPSRPKDFTRKADALTTFMPMESVDEKNGVIVKQQEVPYSKVAKGYTYFEENDVLFAKITPCMQNGKHVIARNLIDKIGFGTTEFHVLRSKREILPEWIWYFIRQPHFLEEATYYFTGAVGQQRVPDDFLADYDIPLALMDEQQRITAKIQELMQEVKQAKESCEKQLEANQALPSAYLREVFESPEAEKWEKKRFDQCVIKRKGLKMMGISQKGYKNEGRYPIVDQGQSLICGYTDDISSVYQGDLPVIIFGDHTRLFKYIDFPFAIGADGTKIISPNTDSLIPKFFYFALLSFNIKNLGYSRHYKLLRNISIPVPDSETQRKVVSELEKKISETNNLQSTIYNLQSAVDALPRAILCKAFRGELVS